MIRVFVGGSGSSYAGVEDTCLVSSVTVRYNCVAVDIRYVIRIRLSEV